MSLVKGTDLTPKERALLFWASFLSLTAAGFGFAFRVAMGGTYGEELGLTNLQIGQVFGASLWPIAITMIGFSLVVDRTGYKIPMFAAFALQALSGVGTFLAESYAALYLFALCAGLGHGIVEAVINPICAAVYPKEKTKWLTILHAAWPAGLVFGTLLIIFFPDLSWQMQALWILGPAVAYALMYLPCKFPVDERVQAGVPYIEMLRQVGFLAAAVASFLMIYEIGNQYFAIGGQMADTALREAQAAGASAADIEKLTQALADWAKPEKWVDYSLYAGVGVGLVFGIAVRGIGKPLFFLLCLLMIPVATAELGTDQWIKKLMTPVLEGIRWDPALGLVFSASIMLVLRVFAGGILKFFSPPALLCVSGLFSAVGLWWLSGSTGAAVFIAFIIYALGQTYYWPCVLGFVSERYPQGGALTLNTVSAIGLLSAGIIGGQLLGVAFDESIHEAVQKEAPALEKSAAEEKIFLGLKHKAIIPEKKAEFLAGLSDENERKRIEGVFKKADDRAGRDVLLYAVRFPAILVIAFGLIVLYFRTKGGYRPVVLAEHNAGGGGDDG